MNNPRAQFFNDMLAEQFYKDHGYYPVWSTKWKIDSVRNINRYRFQISRQFLRESYPGFQPNGCSCSFDYIEGLTAICDFHDLLYYIGGDIPKRKEDNKWFRWAIWRRRRHYSWYKKWGFFYLSWTRYLAVERVGPLLGFGGNYK